MRASLNSEYSSKGEALSALLSLQFSSHNLPADNDQTKDVL